MSIEHIIQTIQNNTQHTIVTHANCPDGISSALILKDALREAEVIFVNYNTPEYNNLQAKPGIIFVDISPPKDRVEEFITAKAIVLDHHITAKETVERFGELGIYADEKEEPGISGAMLAFRVWKEFVKMYTDSFYDFVQNVAVLAGIRDTWQKDNELWDEACIQSNILEFIPQEILIEKGLKDLRLSYLAYKVMEKIVSARKKKSVERFVEKGKRCSTLKNKLIINQGTRLTSDSASLVDDVDLLVGFDVMYENDKVKYIYSLRAPKNSNFNCSELAKYYGGGGHTKAAGFCCEEPEEDPFGEIRTLVFLYEKEKLLQLSSQ